jgi:hypothetical protein
MLRLKKLQTVFDVLDSMKLDRRTQIYVVSVNLYLNARAKEPPENLRITIAIHTIFQLDAIASPQISSETLTFLLKGVIRLPDNNSMFRRVSRNKATSKE